MKVLNKLATYKYEYEYENLSQSPKISLELELVVKDSSFSNKFVVLKIGDVEISVKTAELKAAINNATNKGSYD